MPLSTQVKILRVLQERTFEPVGSAQSRSVDVRIIAASNKDLREAVRQGSFREDLFYRLNVFPIPLPPLRERVEDIPLLVEHFMRQFALSIGKRLGGFSPGALSAMAAYHWPGNVRELQNVVERSIIVAKASIVDVGDLPRDLFGRREGKAGEGLGLVPQDLDAELAGIERGFILEALRRSSGVQVKAAEMLGISERSLWHRIKKLNIQIVKRAAD